MGPEERGCLVRVGTGRLRHERWAFSDACLRRSGLFYGSGYADWVWSGPVALFQTALTPEMGFDEVLLLAVVVPLFRFITKLASYLVAAQPLEAGAVRDRLRAACIRGSLCLGVGDGKPRTEAPRHIWKMKAHH